jgi:uncharacterized protein YdeI (YjbR/CyaY-like superfamily)
MELHKGTLALSAATAQEWRAWLHNNYNTSQAVWLIIYRKGGNTPSVQYPEAVDEALCYGWIDSVPNKRDDNSYYQYFTPRKPKSNWSAVNKKKVATLSQQGKMHEAGLAMIALAKQTGTWTALDNVDALKEPDDMMSAFKKNETALKYWNNFAPSTRRGILEWILNAKGADTRAKRINTTIELAAQNIKANQYTKPK